MNKNRTRPLKLVWNQIARFDRDYYKSAQKPKGASVSGDFDYVGDGDPMHLLEIIRPKGNTSVLPLIIDIHGGGWVYGHKDTYYRYYCMELAKEGYAVINFNYRLAFDHPFPAQIEDIFSLLHWVERNAQEQKFDLNNVYLVGDSAGAHLSALSALIHTSPKLQEIYNLLPAKLTIRALGLSCGVYDFDRLVHMAYELPMKQLLVETIFNRLDYTDHPLYPYASVSAQLNRNMPPMYLVSSKADPLTGETGILVLECKEKKLEHKHRIYPKKLNLPHVFNLKSIYPQSAEVRTEMIDYFARFRG